MTEKEAIERLKYFQQNDGIKRLFSKINMDAVAETEELTALCIKALEKQIPTNREWVNQLSDKDFARFVIYDLPEISRRYSDSVGGITMWLAGKRYDE